jgi:hypothetical protein
MLPSSVRCSPLAIAKYVLQMFRVNCKVVAKEIVQWNLAQHSPSYWRTEIRCLNRDCRNVKSVVKYLELCRQEQLAANAVGVFHDGIWRNWLALLWCSVILWHFFPLFGVSVNANSILE